MTASIFKVHWECWDVCNLHCGFCYRMREKPLDPARALNLIDALADAGLSQIVLAGGDPSLRSDIAAVIRRAKARGLGVEVQTNAQLFDRVFVPLVDKIDLFGFSLDARAADVHDALRGKKGNHERVLRAMDVCDAAGRPYVVRTVYAAENAEEAVGVAELLEGRAGLLRWSLVQFSPIGDGFLNRGRFDVGAEDFAMAAAAVRGRHPALAIDAYGNDRKGGVYFLLKPNGDAYTTVTGFGGERYEPVGNALVDGVATCLSRLAVDVGAHADRYAPLL